MIELKDELLDQVSGGQMDAASDSTATASLLSAAIPEKKQAVPG